MKIESFALLLFLAGPVVQGRQFHGLVAKRDWSKSVHQFNLHRHLTTPTTRDLREGVETSRRLASNAVRLGMGNETHRKVSIFGLLRPYQT